ncbi:MAG: T9SS type A sorting domain-containing protein [Bacteroidales bacterium]|nr:T9SS type A sorting domain-containing protein [Bacteroidales bacterium]
MKTKIQKTACLWAALLFATAAFGQVSIDWQQCYGSYGHDGGYGIQPLGDGYRVLGVTSERNGMCQCGDYHGAWIFDLSPDLAIKRQRCREYSMPAKLVKNDVGEIFQVSEQHGGSSWLSISKLDDEGFDVWNAWLEANLEYSSPYALATATPDGGVAAAATIAGNEGVVSNYFGGNDCWVVKIDADGQLQWQRTLGTQGDETILCLLNARDGGLLVGIYIQETSAGNIGCDNGYSNILVKLDSGGNIEWNRCFPTVAFSDMIEYEDGYLLAGSCADAYGSHDCALMRCDLEGNIQWIKSYGGSGEETVVRVFEDGPKGYTVFGNTTSVNGDLASAAHLGNPANEQGNIWVFHVDELGDLQWERCIGSAKGLQEIVSDVVKTDEGRFLLVGSMTWFAEESSGDVHCTNSALIPNSKTDIWVLQITAEYDDTGATGLSDKNVEVRPNPATGQVTVIGKGIQQVEIHNLLGLRVVSVEGHSVESLAISLEGLPEGVYLVSVLLADGKRHEKKLIVR